jgi:hypothetical protein
MGEGKGLEEIREEGLPSEWDAWGGGFIKTADWLEAIYRSLEEKGA